MELQEAEFVYTGKGKATFRDPNNPKERSEIDTAAILDKLGYLIEGMIVKLILFGDQVIGISLPPKVDLLVTQADPWSKGDTATGGTKQVSVETGLIVKVPPFIVTDDIIRINTETGDYVERVSKA